MVPFIPVPVPSGCRRIDTSIQTGSADDLRHAFPAWCRSFLCQCQAGVEDSTLQPKQDPQVISGTNLQHGAVPSCTSAKLVSKNRHCSPNSIRGQFQALSLSTVPFIPAPVPRGCRRLDTSVQTGSAGDLRHESPAWCRSFLHQCQARVEESTLQSHWARGNLRHCHSVRCRSFLRQCHAGVEESTLQSHWARGNLRH
jgi:hypothetical protein